MSEKPDRYTRWTVIAAGEGGGRIASKYFTRNREYDANPGIDDRVLLLNTNRSDMRNAIDRIESALPDAEDTGRYTATFGSLDGVGNDFEQGEMCANEDFDRIVTRINGAGIDVAQAFLYLTTLGGGTGNGTIPQLIRDLKHDPPTTAFESPNIAHIAFAAWPYDHDGPQQHYNAVCGLSRLLRWYDGSQNADMVLLASNSTVAERFHDDTGENGEHEVVNEWIRRVIDMMIYAGRDASRVIDTQDYIGQPSRIDAYHFTPAIETRMQTIYELSYMFDEAASNAFVPMEPETSNAIYAIVRVPRADLEGGTYDQNQLSQAVHDWLAENGCDDIQHRNQAFVPHDRGDGTADVLLLFGGFDLTMLLAGSVDDFRSHYEAPVDRGSDGSAYLSQQEYQRISQNLEDYMGQSL